MDILFCQVKCIFPITNSTSLQGVIFLRATLSCSWVWLVFHPISYIVTMTLSKLNQQRERCDSFLPCLLQQLSQRKPHRVNQKKKSVLVFYPAVCKQLPQGRPHGAKQERKKCASFLPCLMQQFPQGRQHRVCFLKTGKTEVC